MLGEGAEENLSKDNIGGKCAARPHEMTGRLQMVDLCSGLQGASKWDEGEEEFDPV